MNVSCQMGTPVFSHSSVMEGTTETAKHFANKNIKNLKNLTEKNNIDKTQLKPIQGLHIYIKSHFRECEMEGKPKLFINEHSPIIL